MRKSSVVSLPFLVALAGCASAPDAAPTIEGTQWKLAGATRGELAQNAGSSGITLQLDAGQMSGHGGCNSYRGPYTLAAGALEAGALITTKRGCIGVAGALEMEYHAILARPLRVRVVGGELVMSGEDGELLRFVPVDVQSEP